MKPLTIDYLSDTPAVFDPNTIVKNKELMDLIDKNLPIKLRPTYLNILGGQKVPKKDYQLLVDTIKQILNIEQDGGEDD